MNYLPKSLVCMDSGVGGLAVMARLLDALPDCPFEFFGDTAMMPYGEKPQSVIHDRVMLVMDTITQAVQPLAFVLACNTATAAAYDDLVLRYPEFPIFEPVSTTAHWINIHLESSQKLAILATPGTVDSGRYLRFLKPEFSVLQVACSGLASVIEAGVSSGADLDVLLERYLEPMLEQGATVVVLGCTHYSLIQPYLVEKYPQVDRWVDSSEILAQVALPQIQQILLAEGRQQLTVTGDPALFARSIEALSLPAISPLAPMTQRMTIPVSQPESVLTQP